MKEKWRDILKKYRFAALVALAGVVLMLLPGKKDSMPDAETAEGETFSLEETERRMAEVLGAMDGVGRVQVMLTLRSGETLSLAEDSSATRGSGGGVIFKNSSRNGSTPKLVSAEPKNTGLSCP